MIVGGETLYITLKTGIHGHVSQKKTQRINIYIYIFRTIEASSGN